MHSQNLEAPERIVVGIDVGSTTVKVVAIDAATRSIIWSDYQRHESRQPEKTFELLSDFVKQLSSVAPERMKACLTGSGGKPLEEPIGGIFVQEVNAVTLAVEALNPDAGSVIELGGQDAKIIIFRQNEENGERQAICSMNDKCASGTGATIDKCLIKVGLTQEDAAEIRFDPTKLHKVAAKCGVFAETDVVNLTKSGIPAAEVVCSLADAVVSQNLSVLARGNTIPPKVILLGGPNTYLPILRECWRLRIQESWTQRGFEIPQNRRVDDLIECPVNSQFYAAYGAAIYGLEEPDQGHGFRGLTSLRRHIESRASDSSQTDHGPGLLERQEDYETVRRTYSVPDFESTRFQTGQVVRAAIGLDGGSTSSKAVLVGQDGTVHAKAYRLSQGNPIQDMHELLRDLKTQVAKQNATLEVIGFGVTGYAADVLESAIRADVNIVETIAHMISARHFFASVDVVCDIGGQDIKVLLLQHGEIKDFRLSNQCSAGNGMLLQAMASQFGVELSAYADTAFRARRSPIFSYGCAVFLDSDRVNFQKEGYSKEELLAGMAMVLPKNVWQYVVQIPRLSDLGSRFVLQGGTQYNLAAVKAQADYIRARVPTANVHVHPHCGEAGAIGAAVEALRVVERRGSSTFIGIEEAIQLGYTTRNDESTRCRFCPNLCSRTFVDTRANDGTTSRYISGFSCEKGTVESKESLKELVRNRNALKERYVNLLEYEARLAFRSFFEPASLPAEGSEIEHKNARTRSWKRLPGRRRARRFQRSSVEETARRSSLRIGIPRVLNLYSVAPLFRTYFETLGIPSGNVVFSPPTSQEMFATGAKYGAVDPCFPAKLVQAHVHHLLFDTHRPQGPLHYIFFPAITNVPTFVERTMDSTSCPIVSGTPAVTKAAFTKEVDFFERCGVEYVDGAVTLEEPNYFKKQMFELWGERLGITKDESDFAVDQGWIALRWFDDEIQRRGLEVIESIEESGKLAILVLGRPYHADPGVNHAVLEEFQALGYPVLTIRSIPKDRSWLQRWFQEDLDSGVIQSPLEVTDVWPENYSTNSVQKVWAAKFAARHPNVAVLDLSSFKCGHDAPTYGLIDSVIKAGKKPYMALHDLDANKPAGSQKIRVRTYAHTLERYRERLADENARKDELQRRVAEKRRFLLRERRLAIAEAARRDRELGRELESMNSSYLRYLEEEETVLGLRMEDLDNEALVASSPTYDSVAPRLPRTEPVEWNRRIIPLPVLSSTNPADTSTGCRTECGKS